MVSSLIPACTTVSLWEVSGQTSWSTGNGPMRRLPPGTMKGVGVAVGGRWTVHTLATTHARPSEQCIHELLCM